MLQGIHELSIMVGYEASRDLEEISVQGVRIGTTGLCLTCDLSPLTDYYDVAFAN
jgi:hypothetical protein